MNDDLGKIAVPRTKWPELKEYPVDLDPSYDGMLTLHMFPPEDKNTSFDPYSGLSLQVHKRKSSRSEPGSGRAVAAADLHHHDASNLLGALNVLFEPHSTRNLRFASPAATQLRECCKNGPGKDDPPYPNPGQDCDCGPIPVTKPAATGWWFRAQVNNTNNYPLTGAGGVSPGTFLLRSLHTIRQYQQRRHDRHSTRRHGPN